MKSESLEKCTSLKVVFHRHYRGFTGGHLKVLDYFHHVRASPGHHPAIYFTRNSDLTAGHPWSASPETHLEKWEPEKADILFLAGNDWASLSPTFRQAGIIPVINLIQGLRHTDPKLPLYQYLAHPAIRIFVSQETADAVRSTGIVNGPSFTIPNGIHLASIRSFHKTRETRDIELLILGTKNPDLAKTITAFCRDQQIGVTCVDQKIPRKELLQLIGNSVSMVCLPFEKEGFYLPGLEAMALETLVICPKFRGNKTLYQDGINCLSPDYHVVAILEAIKKSRQLTAINPNPILVNAAKISQEYDLEREKAAFLDILENAFKLWAHRSASNQ